jgi:hypothetical protein
MIRKTAAITAASIAGVVLAGSAAVGANIGILDAADDTGLGTLSAEAAISAPADNTGATVELDPSPATSAVTIAPSDDSGVQTFAVDVAGTVDIETDSSGLHVKAVHPNDGWSWQETTGGPNAVALTFTSGGDTLEFVASLNADGSLDARVDRPVVTSSSPSVTTPAATGGYDDDEYDHDDDHEEDEDHDEDDDHDDHDNHEGGEDDD